VRTTLLAVAAAALTLPIAAQAAPNAAKPAQSTTVTRQAIATDLKKAGFTDVQVRPVAFVARAKDKNGHLVLMAFRPHSFEAVTQLKTTDSAAGADTQQNSQNNTGNNATNSNK